MKALATIAGLAAIVHIVLCILIVYDASTRHTSDASPPPPVVLWTMTVATLLPILTISLLYIRAILKSSLMGTSPLVAGKLLFVPVGASVYLFVFRTLGPEPMLKYVGDACVVCNLFFLVACLLREPQVRD